MNTKKLLIIAVVAVMLAGATSAYGYEEWWDGWINSGWLEYGGYTFNYQSGSDTLEDWTDGDVDVFGVSTITGATFTCTATGPPYLGSYIKLWVNPYGSTKDTGQEGQKEVNGNPTWTGKAMLHRPSYSDTWFDVWGTWNTGDEEDGYYFDYTDCPCPPGGPPTYSAQWYFGGSTPPGITDGEGGSEGERVYFEE